MVQVYSLLSEKIKEIVRMVEGQSVENLQRLFGIFSKALEEMRWFPYIRFSLEMAVVRATSMRSVVSIDELLGRLTDMERRLSIDGPFTDDGKKNVDTESTILKRGDDSTSDISSIWRNAVAEINESKPSLGSYLERGVVVGNEDGILSIGFNGGASVFIELIERKESKDHILKAVRNHSPEVVGIKFTTVANNGNHSPAYNEYLAMTHERQQKEMEDAFSEPIVKEAIEILGGELKELRSRMGE